MAIPMLLLPTIVSFLLFVRSSSFLDVKSLRKDQQSQHLIDEIHETKLKVARLESILEDHIQDLNGKSLYIRKQEKLIDEMTNDIHHLQIVLSSIKLQNDSFREDEKLHMVEEQVRLLWAASRKNNFELHMLESKAQDAEKRLEIIDLQVKGVADIVTEQWIQIQQLEQALQIAEMRASKAKRELHFKRCTFLKFVKSLFGCLPEKLMEVLDPYLFNKESALRSLASQVLNLFEKVFSAAKHYHHQLQGLIRREMERNEYTAILANEEVVFFVASALVTFPLIGAWVCLSLQFN